jgi:hypothetical protein
MDARVSRLSAKQGLLASSSGGSNLTGEKPLTKNELAERFSDTIWQDDLFDLLSLVSLLRDAIIHADYKVSPELSSAIVLTEVGKGVRQALITREKVNPREAQVLTLLAMMHIEPLVDVSATVHGNLAAVISDEIESGLLSYPFIFGKELYLRCADLFSEEREYLTHDETVSLLENSDKGVFHAGPYLVGPYGAKRTDFRRSVAPRTFIPLQHCADHACAAVHGVQLATSMAPEVNRKRTALDKILNSLSVDASDWNGYFRDLLDDRKQPIQAESLATVVHLIGDALGDDELRSFLAYALDSTDGRLRSQALSWGLPRKIISHVDEMSRAQVMHLLLTETNVSLTSLLDACIRDGKITVPEGEIRHAKVNARVSSGMWHQSAQMSHLGVRFVSNDPQLPLLRLTALARSLFDIDSATDMEDLAWTLRESPGQTAQERLESFLRSAPPEDVVRTLFFARRSTVEKVRDELRVADDLSDEEMIKVILWRLGLPLSAPRDTRIHYWQEHDELETLVRTASVGASVAESEIRARSSNYFVALEEHLFDSLIYSTWALTNDHFIDAQPYVYAKSRAEEVAFSILSGYSDGDGDGDGDGDVGETDYVLQRESTLSSLVAGYSRLAKVLEGYRSQEASFRRSEDEKPLYVGRTKLQVFPFNHTVPFLDLTPESQVKLVEVFAQVGADLNDSGIMTARNGLLHAKQKVPSLSELTMALQKARAALSQLESIGGARSTFELGQSTMDRWGNSTTTFLGDRREIIFTSPSPYEWLRLPSLGRDQYIFVGAVFAAPGEVLRFVRGFESEYDEYWRLFPIRPQRGRRTVAGETEEVTSLIETDSFAAARA